MRESKLGKIKGAVLLAVIGIAIGLLGELFPDSLKSKIEGLFPIAFNISFEVAWGFGIALIVIIMVWLVWNSESIEQSKANSQREDNLNSDSIKEGTKNINMQVNTINMEKEEILSLINLDIEKALEELDKRFLGKNATYHDLSNEYVNRPDNFNINTFRGKLRRFVAINWK